MNNENSERYDRADWEYTISMANRVNKDCKARIAGKLEFFNPASNVKDHIGVSMILTAEREGKIKPGITLVEPTSGNTGIALAWVAAAKGYNLILIMPELMTIEQRKILELFGAELVLTPAEEGMTDAVNKAREIVQETDGAFMLQQFKNAANAQIHRDTTAEEIWADTDRQVDIFFRCRYRWNNYRRRPTDCCRPLRYSRTLY